MTKKPLKTIDIDLNIAESDGIAYFRLDSKFLEFLKLCDEKHGIIGFEYNGDFDFGVILGKKQKKDEKQKIKSSSNSRS